MPRREYSPRLRFWLLQGTLCLTFVATLALARALQRLREPGQGHALTRHLEEIGPLKLRMRGPEGWGEQRDHDGITLLERGSEHSRRRLRVWHQYGAIFMSPLEFLVRSGELSASDAARFLAAPGGPDEPAHLGTIMMAGSSAVVVSQTLSMRGIRGQDPSVWVRTVAAAVLPSGDALLMRLDSEGTDADDDLDFLARVAATIELPDAAKPRHGGKVMLEAGVTLRVPNALISAAPHDPLRTGRPLVLVNDSMWLAVDVAPCVVLAGEDLEALAARLAVRDPLYRIGPVKRLDQNTVMCERFIAPGDGTGGLFPAITYLHRDATGRGVLLEFRWNAAASQSAAAKQRVAALWNELREGIVFEDIPPIAELLEAGIAARLALPRELAELLANEGVGSDFWEWFHGSLNLRSRLTVAHDLKDGRLLEGRHELVGSPPLSGAGSENGSFWLSQEGSRYSSFVKRIGPTGRTTIYDAVLSEKQLKMTVTEGGRMSTTYTGPVSESYIPGAMLPLALGLVEAKPMLLQTDTLPNPIGWSATGPVTVLLTPVDEPDRKAGDESDLRCWMVEVMGSGRSSRWYFNESGLLQFIEFVGGVQLQRVQAPPATQPATTQPAASL